MKIEKIFTVKNILIAGGVAVTTAIIVKSIRAKQFKMLVVDMVNSAKVDKSSKSDALITSDALNPLFAKTISNPVNTYSDDAINTVAKKLVKLDGYFNTDEKGIIKEIKTNVKSKYFMSLVSDKFEQIKGYGFSTMVDKWFNKTEKSELFDYLNNLPNE